MKKEKVRRSLFECYGIDPEDYYLRPICFLNLWICIQCNNFYFTLDLEPLLFDAGLGLCWKCNEEYHYKKIDDFL